MSMLRALFLILRGLLRSRAALTLENLVLRQQLGFPCLRRRPYAASRGPPAASRHRPLAPR